MSRARMLTSITMSKTKEDGGDPNRAGFRMPAGSEVVMVGMNTEGGVDAIVLAPPNGVAVWHPVVLIQHGQVGAPLIGKTLGKPLGLIPIQGRPCAIVPELPWPSVEAGLEAVAPAGQG